jgi:predicted GNAT family N-acyltransferase
MRWLVAVLRSALKAAASPPPELSLVAEAQERLRAAKKRYGFSIDAGRES